MFGTHMEPDKECNHSDVPGYCYSPLFGSLGAFA